MISGSSGELDAEIASLEIGEDPAGIRGQVDLTSATLLKAQHDRAKTLS